MKIMYMLILISIIFTGCTINGEIDVSKINETELNNLINQYQDDKDVKKFIKKNEIDLNKLSNEPKEDETLSCFALKSKKKDKCMDQYGNVKNVNPNQVMLRQKNIREGITVIYDELNWNSENTRIKKIDIITNSNKYDIYLLEDGGAGDKIKIKTNLARSNSISLNKNYKSSDSKVYLLIQESKTNEYTPSLFGVYIEGIKK